MTRIDDWYERTRAGEALLAPQRQQGGNDSDQDSDGRTLAGDVLLAVDEDGGEGAAAREERLPLGPPAVILYIYIYIYIAYEQRVRAKPMRVRAQPIQAQGRRSASGPCERRAGANHGPRAPLGCARSLCARERRPCARPRECGRSRSWIAPAIQAQERASAFERVWARPGERERGLAQKWQLSSASVCTCIRT